MPYGTQGGYKFVYKVTATGRGANATYVATSVDHIKTILDGYFGYPVSKSTLYYMNRNNLTSAKRGMLKHCEIKRIAIPPHWDGNRVTLMATADHLN